VGAGIGETAVVDVDIECAIYVSLGLVKTFKMHTNSDYLAIIFNSPYGVEYAKGNISSGGGSAGNFNLGRIRAFKIPFPPISEQKTIVAKVEKLLAICDQLETQITQNQTHAEQLMQAVLKEAFQQNSCKTELECFYET
jgi:type I restriction enzyme S subunit